MPGYPLAKCCCDAPLSDCTPACGVPWKEKLFVEWEGWQEPGVPAATPENGNLDAIFTQIMNGAATLPYVGGCLWQLDLPAAIEMTHVHNGGGSCSPVSTVIGPIPVIHRLTVNLPVLSGVTYVAFTTEIIATAASTASARTDCVGGVTTRTLGAIGGSNGGRGRFFDPSSADCVARTLEWINPDPSAPSGAGSNLFLPPWPVCVWGGGCVGPDLVNVNMLWQAKLTRVKISF